MKTYGRTTILASISEKELLALNDKDLDNKIIEIISNSAEIHQKNREETIYLKDYVYGDQDIKEKVKQTREEINNKKVENWAWAFVDFKKNYLLGRPIQYVQRNDSGSDEITLLNKYVGYEGKTVKDENDYFDDLVCGRGFTYINKDIDKTSTVLEDDEAPFEIINCPAEDTEVVYSSRLGNEQLFAYIDTNMVYYTIKQDNKEIAYEPHYYHEYQVYLRNKVITYNDKDGTLKRIGEPLALLYNEHLIIESYLNPRRISLVEIGKDLFDSVNYLESLDADDIEQFVNAIMVFKNASVDETDIEQIKKLGAVCISSTDGQQASVDLLQQRLNSSDTQSYYNRLLDAMHMILGIPKASDDGQMQNGDTGKAKLTGQGFTSAGIRATGDENMIKLHDNKKLKVILKVCKENTESGIKTIKVSDIENKLQIDQRDNLLTKTQGLMNLYACDIPREIANSIVNLFNDPHSVSVEQEKLFGKQTSRNQSNQGNIQLNSEENVDVTNDPRVSDKDRANAQNNQIKNKEMIDSQDQ